MRSPCVVVFSAESGTQTDDPELPAPIVTRERQKVQMVSVGPAGLARPSNRLSRLHVTPDRNPELTLGILREVAVLGPVVVLGRPEVVMRTYWGIHGGVYERNVVEVIGILGCRTPAFGISSNDIHTTLI
ncbi:MAG: hypothetical protein Q8P56_01475 [Candidatus Uhrbacteria bacterium]|nr:hypothetical protein [Candidatus Uhrbacteria bacterium]